MLGYLKRFSATEKAVFGVFALAAVVTAIVMAGRVNSYFLTEVPADGGSLHEGLIGLPHTVNPVIAVTDADRDIASLVYAGLTRSSGGATIPDLASGWTISPDGLTYTFELRPGLTFQNGDPLTADDVIFTIDRIKDPALKSPHANDWAGVTATSTSPTTVVLSLKQPSSSFLAQTSLGILPRKIWEAVSDDQFIFSQYNIQPVGAGPYRVSTVDRDQGGIPTDYRLAAWGGYHAGAPHLSEIVFTFFPDSDHALDALAKGSIDSLGSLPPAAAKELATNGGEPYAVRAAPLDRVFGVFFNQNKNAALADANVRAALDMSVDRQAIVDTVLDGYGVPVASPLPAGFDAGTTSAPVPSADLDGARALMAKSGWKYDATTGLLGKKASKKAATTTLAFTLYTADTPDLKAAASMVRDAWDTLGANVTLSILPASDLYQSVIKPRNYDTVLFGEAVAKGSDLYAFWHSSQRNAPGLNIALYTNSKADKTLDDLRTATSTTVMDADYAKLQSMIAADDPAIFLYSPQFIYALPKSLRDASIGTIASPADRFSTVADWYMSTERVWNIFANTRS